MVLFLVGLLPKPDLSDYSDWQISIEVSWVGAPLSEFATEKNVAVCQNLVPLVNPKIAGKWMFIPTKNGINRY